MEPTKDTDILITGGYEIVGRRVAAALASEYPGRLLVAVLSAEKAGQLVAELRYGVRGKIYGLPPHKCLGRLLLTPLLRRGARLKLLIAPGAGET